MAVTNAISSIIILGALMQIGSDLSGYNFSRIVCFYGWYQYFWCFSDETHACHVSEVLKEG